MILFEIDGLAEPVLRRALERGPRADDGALARGGQPSRRSPGSATSPRRPGASQAGLLLGSNHDMPAFRWYEKETGQTMVSNHGKDAAEIERRHSDGGGLLAVGGASRGNMFSGDAPRCSATMSVLRDRERSSAREYFAYFADPYGFTRTHRPLFLGRLLERRAARRQRKARRGAHRPRRPLPVDARRDHRDHARPQRRHPDGRHRRGRARRLLDLRRLRRGRPPLRHRAARRLRGAEAARRPARPARAARSSRRPAPTTWSSSPTTARARAARSASATASSWTSWSRARWRSGEVFAPAAADEGLTSRRRRADRRPRRGQRRRPAARARHPRPARRRRGRARAGPRGRRGRRETDALASTRRSCSPRAASA